MLVNNILAPYPQWLGGFMLLIACLIAGCASQPANEKKSTAKISSSAFNTKPLSSSDSQEFSQAVKFLKQANGEKALPVLQKLQGSNPQHPAIALNLANSYFLVGKIHEAHNQLATIPRNAETTSQIDNLQGLLAIADGQYNQAQTHFETALAAPIPNPESLYNLGLLYDIYWQNPAKAIEYYQAYLSKIGGDKDLENWVAELKRKSKP